MVEVACSMYTLSSYTEELIAHSAIVATIFLLDICMYI